jgi:non-specific serine/threonine protein kinase
VGGTGKTRLALEAASGWVEDFEHGIWLVELARITDPALIPSNLASLFGLREEADLSIEQMLHSHLRNKHLLLILDNCEHLIKPVALFAETILHVAPGVKILATSREALGITGEMIYLVPSLEIPDLAQLSSLERLAHCEAVRLFVERAKSVLPAFALTEANASVVAQICQRLDGIPLALELAAARLKVLSVAQISARLSDRFRLLTGGSRAALPRQQTLQATIDWSYELLTDLERTLFRRLAVFLGGWTLEAAEVICACQELDSNQVLDTLASLVNKSLVIADLREGQVERYHMLETIRHFALEKLFEAGETLQVREAHLSFYVEWAEVQEARLKAADQITATFEIDAEIHNIRSALGWAFDEGQGPHPLQGLQLANSMAYYFDLRGLDINPWLDRGLELIQGEDILKLDVRAKAYLTKGHQNFLPDPVGSSFWLKESKKLYQMTENRDGLALSLAYLGACFAEMGQPVFDQAWEAVNQAEKILREHGEKWDLAEVLHMQLWISQLQGDIKSAQQFYVESTAIYKNSGDMIKYTDVGLCITKAFQELYGFREQYELIAQDRIALGGRMNSKYIMEKGYYALALSALYKKDFSTMETHLQRILGFLKEREANPRSIIWATRQIGVAALLQGKNHLARQRFLEYISLAQTIQDAGGILMFPILMAGVADLEGHPQAAARLIGAFEAQLEMRGKNNLEIEQDQYQYISVTARSHLDEATFEAERAEGRLMTLEQAIAYAKEVTGKDEG